MAGCWKGIVVKFDVVTEDLFWSSRRGWSFADGLVHPRGDWIREWTVHSRPPSRLTGMTGASVSEPVHSEIDAPRE